MDFVAPQAERRLLVRVWLGAQLQRTCSRDSTVPPKVVRRQEGACALQDWQAGDGSLRVLPTLPIARWFDIAGGSQEPLLI